MFWVIYRLNRINRSQDKNDGGWELEAELLDYIKD